MFLSHLVSTVFVRHNNKQFRRFLKAALKVKVVHVFGGIFPPSPLAQASSFEAEAKWQTQKQRCFDAFCSALPDFRLALHLVNTLLIFLPTSILRHVYSLKTRRHGVRKNRLGLQQTMKRVIFPP